MMAWLGTVVSNGDKGMNNTSNIFDNLFDCKAMQIYIAVVCVITIIRVAQVITVRQKEEK